MKRCVFAGSKFKVVNNRDKNFAGRKLQARMEQLEEIVGRYPDELYRADREPAAVSEGRVSRLKVKITHVKDQMQRLNQIGVQMQTAPDLLRLQARRKRLGRASLEVKLV
jgi:hypothetical protein